MQSKRSFFNRKIYCTALRRYWVLWVLYAIAALVLVPLPMIDAMQNKGLLYSGEWFSTSVIWLLDAHPMLLVLSLLFSGIIAATLFSYLYQPRQTGLMASLPVRRETMFLSTAAAGLTGMFLGDLLMILACLGVEAAYGQVYLPALGVFLLIAVLENLFFLGFALFCCMLTGNILAGPAVYMIFNFTAVGVETLGRYLLCSLVYGMPRNGIYQLSTEWLSPAVQMLRNLSRVDRLAWDGVNSNHIASYSFTMEGLGTLGIYALVGVVFCGLALVLYRRRNMETAGDVVAIPFLVPVFKVCACLAGALVCCSLVTNMLPALRWYGAPRLLLFIALMILGGMIGWFIAQMLVEKTFRVFDHGWKGLGAMCLLYVLVLTGAEYDWTGYERRLPDAEQVQEVSLDSGSTTIRLKQPENIQQVIDLQQRLVEHKSHHEQAAAQYKEQRRLELQYVLENGKILERCYWLDSSGETFTDPDSDLRAVEVVCNLPEAVEYRLVRGNLGAEAIYSGSVYYYSQENDTWMNASHLSPADYGELYTECILPDLADGTLGRVYLAEDETYAKSVYNCQIYLEFRTTQENLMDQVDFISEEGSAGGDAVKYYYSTVALYVPVSAQRTVQWLQEHDIELVTMYDCAQAQGYEYRADGVYYPEETTEEMAAGVETAVMPAVG